MEVAGWLYDRESSRREPARLRPSPKGVTIVVEHADIDVHIGTARVSARVKGVARRIELHDGRVFETEDDDGLERVLGSRALGIQSRLARLEAFRPRIIGIALALIALIAAVVQWGIPLLADGITALVPARVERAIGDHVFQILDERMAEDSALDSDRRREVEALAGSLAAAAGLRDGTIQLKLRRFPDEGANAFALPGGIIVVTDSLIELAPSEDALAGVIAHEIAHVEHRHGMRRLARGAALAVVATLLTGDISSVVDQVVALGAGLLVLSHSRGFERDADERAIAILRKAGRDPRALATMLLALNQREDFEPPAWLSTHPMTAERVERIERLSAEAAR